MSRFAFFLLIALLALCSLDAPRARACGGCFLPPPNPTGMPSAVTAHRMALAISPTQTTLWDQIQYAGNPEDFVWVLPVADGARVMEADNAFFLSLEQQTQLTLVAPAPPRTSCPDPCGTSFGCGTSAFRGASAAPSDGGSVSVQYEGVVGPYETATIRSEDPMALVEWLQSRGYGVPTTLIPIIADYVAQGMSFAALRLQPGRGVQQMTPVRVTAPGLAVTLPLRMVAAGVVDKVGLELFVIAESRYEAQNFDNVELDRTQITYDWATRTFDYDARAAAALDSGTGRNWLTEFASTVNSASAGTFVTFDPQTRTPHYAGADWQVATVGQRSPNVIVTRMRSELPVIYLDQDLVLQASRAPANLVARIDVIRDVNRGPEPLCATSCGEPVTNAAGTTGASTRGAGAGRCTTSPGGGRSAMIWLPVLACALALGLRRYQKRG